MIAYRLLTEEDGSPFCHKVTAALDKGWTLYGDPTFAFDPVKGVMMCGQAVIKEVDGPYDPNVKLGTL